MPAYVRSTQAAFSRAFLPPFLPVRLRHRFAHTQRRTLPEFSLEGKVAVGESQSQGSRSDVANRLIVTG